jgi:hypothetical protein
VRKHIHQKLKTSLFPLVIILVVFFIQNALFSGSDAQEKPEHQVQKAKIFQEIYPIISESDLYCSFLALDGENMDIEIVGGEREYEKVLFSDSDVVYINQGKGSGLEKGQLFLILEVGPQIKDIGPIAFKRGRARVLDLGEAKSTAQIEKACGQVMIGNFLVPFQEKEGMLGKDLGYDVPPEEVEGLKGSIIYVQGDYNQIGSGHWALIDMGQDDGVYFGQQLIIYRKPIEGAPIQILGNSVVIDVQKRTSTIKILSCRDALELGDHIQARS